MNTGNNELLEKYFNYLIFERGLSENTITAYKNDLLIFENFLKDKKIIFFNKVKYDDIKEFIRFRNNFQIKQRSIARELISIKNFYKFLLNEKYIENDFIFKFESIKFLKKLPNYLAIEEITQMLKLPDLNKKTGQRDKVLLELLYSTGIRASEIINLKINDIDIESGFIKVFGKGSKERIIPLYFGIINKIKSYIENVRPKFKAGFLNLLFLNKNGKKLSRVGLFKIIKKYSKKLKIEATPHTFRHTFATHLIQDGADIRSVQEMLGHSNINTTEIYTHLNNDAIMKDYKKHPFYE